VHDLTGENEVKQIVLTLPYPISSNRYWRPVKLAKHITIVPTKEAKQFKAQVRELARAAGILAPMVGRMQIEVWLYPNRPQDYQKRQRQHGDAWDDTVQCIDLDNANKVLLDALKDVVMGDDKFVRRIMSQRMEPDDKPARVVVRITAIDVPKLQLELTA
jgi:crossover junction endodeoxyribonuclease RusA